jgi:hypothetical protein
MGADGTLHEAVWTAGPFASEARIVDRMRVLLLASVLLLACSKTGIEDPPSLTTATAASAAATAATAAAKPALPGLTPDAITVAEVKAILPVLPGSRALRELNVIATAVDGSVCIDNAGDNSKMADKVVEKLLEAGWESRPPRQTADANTIAIDARKRPYLLRASVIQGTAAAAAALADGGAAADCNLTSQIKVTYFVSKSDASFGPR